MPVGAGAGPGLPVIVATSVSGSPNGADGVAWVLSVGVAGVTTDVSLGAPQGLVVTG